jgi:hypothetical protein
VGDLVRYDVVKLFKEAAENAPQDPKWEKAEKHAAHTDTLLKLDAAHDVLGIIVKIFGPTAEVSWSQLPPEEISYLIPWQRTEASLHLLTVVSYSLDTSLTQKS